MRFADLTDEQRCVLLNAVEESYLFSVLMECAPGPDWPDRMPWIPQLARIVEDVIDKGLVTLRPGPASSCLVTAIDCTKL